MSRLISGMRGLGFLSILLICTGCSTSLKEYNPKMGLLDILAQMQPAYHASDLAAESAIDSSEEGTDPASSGAFPIPPRGKKVHADMPGETSAATVPARQPARLVPASASEVSLQWPLKRVEITSPYGRRGREFHEGIDLRARPGTPVYAAHAGQVLYSGNRISGYGDMIVLRNSSGLATVYAHASRLVVHRGEWVRQGELIAYTGESGDARGPHLHFEVRKGVDAVNPLNYLPRPSGRRLALR